jgi:hypothetical protein
LDDRTPMIFRVPLDLAWRAPPPWRCSRIAIEAREQLVARGVVEDEPAADAATKRQELLGGQDAQLAQHGGQSLLRLVEDEHGAHERLGDMIAPALAQRFEAAPAIVRGERDTKDAARQQDGALSLRRRLASTSEISNIESRQAKGNRLPLQRGEAGDLRQRHEHSSGKAESELSWRVRLSRGAATIGTAARSGRADLAVRWVRTAGRGPARTPYGRPPLVMSRNLALTIASMNITSQTVIEQALSGDRDSFVAWLPCLFLWGSIRELAASAADVDANDLYAGRTLPIISPVDLRTPPSKVPLVLPIRKRQPTLRHMITIGRTAHNDVVIPDTSVSKFHAYLANPGDGSAPQVLELCDASSTNGTFLEDRRLKARVPIRIACGSNLRFGVVSMKVLDASLVWERLQPFRR